MKMRVSIWVLDYSDSKSAFGGTSSVPFRAQQRPIDPAEPFFQFVARSRNRYRPIKVERDKKIDVKAREPSRIRFLKPPSLMISLVAYKFFHCKLHNQFDVC